MSFSTPIGKARPSRHTVKFDTSSNTSHSPPSYADSIAAASIYGTPQSTVSGFVKKYSLQEAEASYFYIPPCSTTIESKKPITINARSGMYAEGRKNGEDSRIDLEWIPHSTPAALSYLGIAISAICYYSSCFLRQYGNYTKSYASDWLGEAFLTRVVMVQWLVLATLLITGLVLYRRIMMPLYIFLAVISTNGTLVLFVVKLKQLLDGRIDKFDVPLNLLGLLLFCAVVHDLVYLYAMHLNLAARGTPIRRERRNSEKYYSNIRSNYYYGPETDYV